jgi:pre-60S factor REI1
MAFIVHGASAFQGAQLDIATAISQPKEENALTCMSCGGFTAASFEELREHYKTEWHRHNLKRKVAELAPLAFDEFEERVAAFLGNQSDVRSKKKEHLGKKARDKAAKREQAAQHREEKQKERAAAQEAGGGMEIEEGAEEPAKRAQPDFASMTEEEYMEWREENAVNLQPGDSLFDRHSEDNLELNLEYMSIQYGFFIPFHEHCRDVPMLMEYLGQRLAIGCVCLWCNKSFHSLGAVQAHMRSKSHCKINLEGCEEEYQDFYEVDLLSKSAPVDGEDDWDTEEEEEVEMEDAEGLAREDSSSHGAAVPTQGKLAEAARMSKKHAKTINVLEVGDAVLGHRAFRQYYRQKLRPEAVGKYQHRSAAHTKIQALLTDVYRANNIMTVYKGRSNIAKVNKDAAKRDVIEQDKWWAKLGIRANKFHQVRRCDYHA